jgi:predicted transcriptional regulator
MEDVLELETRRKIYEVINKNPGLHLSKISGMLGMRTSLAEYHLRYLEKHDVITVEKGTGFPRYYIKGKVGTKAKHYSSILRQETVLSIVFLLLKNEMIQHKDILENMNCAPSTLSYHLNKMVHNGIIEVKRYGDKRGYKIKDKDEIISWLIKYKPFDLYEGFADVWADINI